MRRMGLIAAAVMLLSASPAFAGQPTTTNNNHNQNTNNNNADATSISSLTFESSISGNNGDVGNSSQPGAIGFPSPASGPCVGASYGGALGLSMITIGGSASTIEEACRQDEHIRIGMADPQTRPQAERDWYALDATLFHHDNMDPTMPPKQTSALPMDATPVQTASAASGSDYIGPPNAPTVTKMAALAQGTNK